MTDVTWIGEHAAEWAKHYGGRAAASAREPGYAPDRIVYQDRLDAISFTQAFARNDRATYDMYAATRDPRSLAAALAYVAAMFAADCAAVDLDAAGETVPDDPRDPKFVAAIAEVMDGLRERALSGLEVDKDEAASMRRESKELLANPDVVVPEDQADGTSRYSRQP